MSQKAVLNCMKDLIEVEDIAVLSYPILPYGLKVIDQSEDYIIFFYDTNTNQVIHLFKDAEDYWFRDGFGYHTL
ncbi:hypothetical protein [Virgibacillus ihumii]|uniref:hypothetical protein n=1 Tax=Virgibacillus ihumii TaxID=2686091 RepID=UPI00157DBA51|nr:hypothetical protein [Virgibacillus ihumii]